MADTPTGARQAFGHVAAKFAEITDEVLFGDVWRRAGLSPRDRSLVTVSCLISAYRINELPFHMKTALTNGVTRDEIVEMITHLAFYAGWPAANTAVAIADKVFAEASL
jgi:4-carboxymuconolactone decarboxylase